MSTLARFEIGGVRYKARIFEHGSRREVCSVCQERKFGVLLRFIDPDKKERLICHECLIKLACHLPIREEDKVKVVVHEPKPKRKRAVKKKKAAKKKLIKKSIGDKVIKLTFDKEAQFPALGAEVTCGEV